jgi:hypothetical protein
MGLSIHYSGRIADKSKLPQLIEEVEEIANVHGWKSHVYERELPMVAGGSTTRDDALTNNDEVHDGKLYGIDFAPDGCERVSFCFLSNGRMSSIMQLSCWGEFSEDKSLFLHNVNIDEQGEVEMHSEEVTLTPDDYHRYLYQCSTKTQFAGSRAHEMIIAVFKYIANTFLTEFEIIDEAQYWETGDKDLLQTQFARNKLLIDNFESIIKEEDRLPDEDVDKYILRILGRLPKK